MNDNAKNPPAAGADGELDLDGIALDPACAAKIPAALALRRLVLPLSAFGGRIHVAMADPSDAAAIAAVARETGMECAVHRAARADLRAKLVEIYGAAADAAPASGLATDPVAAAEGIIRAAALRRASDIHLDPDEHGLRVRFRVDGELEEMAHLPVAVRAGLVSRLKVMAGMDIAERRSPQDGAFVWRDRGAAASIDVRMATLPVRHGERITLRLLESGGERLSIGRLGLSQRDRDAFEAVLGSPHGLVLLTGPTGSGKTTTLYAAIMHLLSRRALNILTVEDPVEYEIPGVAQAEVDSSDKVNFAKALKSLLRHDPDAVMIGEIRDSESLDIAVKASLTGHLVLSTLHTNNAVSAVTRLEDMGLEPHLVAATLRLSAAQRLVRSLCQKCRESCAPDEVERAAFGFQAGDRVFRSGGCLFCAGRGYRGRAGLFELFAPDREIASMIASGARETEIDAAARARGMRSLAEDARDKCLAGLTSVAEAIRAVGR